MFVDVDLLRVVDVRLSANKLLLWTYYILLTLFYFTLYISFALHVVDIHGSADLLVSRGSSRFSITGTVS